MTACRRRSRTSTRRRGTPVGLGSAAGVFLAAAIAPLAAAPTAHADLLDLILDPVADVASAVPVDAAAIAGAVADPVGGFDAAVAQLFNTIDGSVQAWITGPVGEAVDPVINSPSVFLFGRDLIGNGITVDATDTANHSLIGGLDPALFGNLTDGGFLAGDGGHGAAGTVGFDGGVGFSGGSAGLVGDGGPGGTGAPGAAGGDGGSGGLLLGDGGRGGDGGPITTGPAGGAGGSGGAAPALFFGVGGHGGHGGDGSVGGGGGDGGSGIGLFDIGGHGGNAGHGTLAGALPALGGAGGNGGFFGSHGAVGDFGTQPGFPSGPASITGPTGLALPYTTTGQWLTNSDGQVVILHGLNEVVKLPPYEPSVTGFGDADAAFLAANGFNAVRLGVDWAAVEPAPGVFDDAYLASLDQTVQTLANHGIVSILDMHQDLYGPTFGGEGAPAWATETGGLPNIEVGFPYTYVIDPAENHAWDAFWSNADAPNGVGLEDDYAQMWEHVASYFNGNPDVAGFEIINEPWPGSPWLLSLFGLSNFGAQELTPFYDQLASAIRAVDPTTPVFFEPQTLSGEGAPISLGTVDASHTVFSFHDYCVVNDLTGGSFGCGLLDGLVANNAEAYAQSHDIPAFMTEFGAGNNDAALVDNLQAADQDRVGWTEWNFTGQGDITGSPSIESLVYNPALPPAGANVDTAKLATLAEPYPQVVSGTPNSWSFDNGTFTFSYSTEKADGLGDFGARSQTTISVPSIEYPNGYHVTVTGGHVVSATNAPELVIASDRGATAVNVTVSPGS